VASLAVENPRKDLRFFWQDMASWPEIESRLLFAFNSNDKCMPY
jgi:hypothetical protein